MNFHTLSYLGMIKRAKFLSSNILRQYLHPYASSGAEKQLNSVEDVCKEIFQALILTYPCGLV